MKSKKLSSLQEETDTNFFPVENGVLTVGDLWDMRTSKRVGFNLFGNITSEGEESALNDILEVDGIPGFVGDFAYTKDSKKDAEDFGFGATITCDLLGGMIKISGGFDFELGFSKESSSEKVKLRQRSDKHIAKLKGVGIEDFMRHVNPHVKQLLKNPGRETLKSATHVVTQVILGGVQTSTLSITQTKKGDNYKFGFNIEGKAELGILSGKMSASASVGEDIKISNYQCTINLQSVPPVTAPLGVEDYVPSEESENNSQVTTEFHTRLNDLKGYFTTWQKIHDGGPTVQLVGVPIAFRLQPISSIFTPENDEDENTPIPDELDESATLSELNKELLRLRELSEPSYLKRGVIAPREQPPAAALPRAVKILEEPSHSITEEIETTQLSIRVELDKQYRLALESYMTFKADFYPQYASNDARSRALAKLREDISGIRDKVQIQQDIADEKIPFWKGTIKTYLRAVLLKEDEEGAEKDPEFEEGSPLIYFSNREELEFWTKSQRFCKLLYRSFLTEEDGPLQAMRNQIYSMSHAFGSIYIQPGFAYPFESSEQLLSLITPNGSKWFSKEEVQPALDFLRFLATLAQYQLQNEDGTDIPQIAHLYQTYCEIHGLRFNLANTVDLIPLLSLIEVVFSGVKICYSYAELLINLPQELAVIISADGVQNSRDSLFTMMLFQENTLPTEMYSSTFDIAGYDDVPPVFLSWEGEPRAVCLDHLDTLVFLWLVTKPGEEANKATNLEEINDILGFEAARDFQLCTTQRSVYVGEVAKWDKPPERVKHDDECPILLEMVTGLLRIGQVSNAPLFLLNPFTLYVSKIVEIFLGDQVQFLNPQYWIKDQHKFEMEDLESPLWMDLNLSLSKFFEDGEDAHGKYYFILQSASDAMGYVSGDEFPDPSHRQGPDFETTEGQYEYMKSFVLADEQASAQFKAGVHEVGGLDGKLSPKATAKLFMSESLRELSQHTRSRKNLYRSVALLQQIIGGIANAQSIPLHLCHEAIHFTLETIGSYPEILPKYETEIVTRVRRDVHYKRFYHVASTLVENTERSYSAPGLNTFQYEIKRLSSLTDWWNLIRLLETMSCLEEATLNRIWRNKKFRILMMENYKNEYVLEALVKAFMVEGPSVPRFIPRDIAVAMLRYGVSADGYPYLFVPLWTTEEVLLKSLQVLWVEERLPEDFQRLLLRNVLYPEGIVRNVFTRTGILDKLYWNEGKEYFTQVWDLDSILVAIEALLEKEEGPKTKIRKVNNLATNKKILDGSRFSKAILALSSNTQDYIKFRSSSSLTPTESFLYHIKLCKLLSIALPEFDPFNNSTRVDNLTAIFGAAERPLLSELFSLLQSRYESSFALPILTRNPDLADSYISLSVEQFLRNNFQKGSLPKVITCVRLGPDYVHGKSSFLNAFFSREALVFASRQEGSQTPEYLSGYCESFSVSESTALWESIQEHAGEERIFILNLHGNILDLPLPLVKLVQGFTSNFIIFCNPHPTWDTLEQNITAAREILSPGHAEVLLYIEPGEDYPPVEGATLYPAESEKNLANFVTALKSALNRRGRYKPVADSSGIITTPEIHPDAVQFVALLQGFTLSNVKSSLVMSQVRRNKAPLTAQELQAHWDSDPIYSTILLQLSTLLEQTEGATILQIVQDVATLLSEFHVDNSHQGIAAWKGLASNQTFGDYDLSSNLKKDLLPYFQRNVESSTLTMVDLLFELCRVEEVLPGLNLIDGIPLLAALFDNCSSILPVPALPAKETFFTEEWSLRLRNILTNRRVQVVSCLGGGEGVGVPTLLESLFGPDFTSSLSLAGWSLNTTSGLSMKLIHLQEVTNGVESILLLQARPLAQQASQGYSKRAERDRQIATFLLTISNLTLVMDWGPELSQILQVSFLAMNKVKEWPNDRKPQLIWVGLEQTLVKTDVTAWLTNTRAWLLAHSAEEYDGISFLGNKTVDRAVSSLEEEGVDWIFNLRQVKEEEEVGASLRALSDSILSCCRKNASESEQLTDFLPILAPTWKEIQTLPFPYPDLDEVERAKQFRDNLHSILNKVDECFQFHVETFPQLLDAGMRDIIHSWVKREEDMSVSQKKVILWKSTAINLQEMFKDCILAEEENCVLCAEEEELLEQLMDDWEDLDGSPLTELAFLRKVDAYKKREQGHQLNLAKQIMNAFEERILQEEEEEHRYPLEDPEFGDEQEFALMVSVQPSDRRMVDDVKETFKNLKWPEVGSDWSFLRTLPAYEDNQEVLEDAIAAEMEEKLESVATKVIWDTGSQAIYQTGMARLLEERVVGSLLEFEQGRRLLGSFKLAVIAHCLAFLEEELQEDEWRVKHDPLTVFLKRPI